MDDCEQKKSCVIIVWETKGNHNHYTGPHPIPRTWKPYHGKILFVFFLCFGMFFACLSNQFIDRKDNDHDDDANQNEPKK
jgi:hypothetical protein